MSISMSISGIDKEFDRLNKELDTLSVKKLEEDSDAMIKDLVFNTPIDTGNARAEWSRTKVLFIKGRPFINIINKAPYIQFLNAGSSKQAPAFFIERIAMKYGKPVGSIVKVYSNDSLDKVKVLPRDGLFGKGQP